MKYFFRAMCLSIILILVGNGATVAEEVVVPSNSASEDLVGANGFPFNLAPFVQYGIETMRYQQVYSADEFLTLSQSIMITEIRFRPDQVSGAAFSSTLPDVQISLSTSGLTTDGLSATFADNVGADEVIVHDGPLSLSSALSGAGPMDFDITIVLSTPFLYDPAKGDLLLDVRNYGGGETTFFDAVVVENDTISRSFTNTVGDVNSTTAALVDTGGLVTKFVYTTVEAPESFAVVIDVKPGSGENKINLKSKKTSKGKAKGKPANAGPAVLVAILTDSGYDATLTDVDSVRLGDPLLGGTAAPSKSSLQDVDDDGDLDVLLHFSQNELVNTNALSDTSMILVLTAQTIDGIAIDGMDAVNVMSK